MKIRHIFLVLSFGLAVFMLLYTPHHNQVFVRALFRTIKNVGAVALFAKYWSNYLPTEMRIRCVLVHIALMWCARRSYLRDKLQNGTCSPLCSIEKSFYDRAARFVTKHIDTLVEAYMHFVNFMSLVSFSFRERPIGLDSMAIDNGWRDFVRELSRA